VDGRYVTSVPIVGFEEEIDEGNLRPMHRAPPMLSNGKTLGVGNASQSLIDRLSRFILTFSCNREEDFERFLNELLRSGSMRETGTSNSRKTMSVGANVFDRLSKEGAVGRRGSGTLDMRNGTSPR
jgi:hypothetical protein